MHCPNFEYNFYKYNKQYDDAINNTFCWVPVVGSVTSIFIVWDLNSRHLRPDLRLHKWLNEVRKLDHVVLISRADGFQHRFDIDVIWQHRSYFRRSVRPHCDWRVRVIMLASLWRHVHCVKVFGGFFIPSQWKGDYVLGSLTVWLVSDFTIMHKHHHVTVSEGTYLNVVHTVLLLGPAGNSIADTLCLINLIIIRLGLVRQWDGT